MWIPESRAFFALWGLYIAIAMEVVAALLLAPVSLSGDPSWGFIAGAIGSLIAACGYALLQMLHPKATAPELFALGVRAAVRPDTDGLSLPSSTRRQQVAIGIFAVWWAVFLTAYIAGAGDSVVGLGLLTVPTLGALRAVRPPRD